MQFDDGPRATQFDDSGVLRQTELVNSARFSGGRRVSMIRLYQTLPRDGDAKRE
jgi:hypothetical protein